MQRPAFFLLFSPPVLSALALAVLPSCRGKGRRGGKPARPPITTRAAAFLESPLSTPLERIYTGKGETISIRVSLPSAAAVSR